MKTKILLIIILSIQAVFALPPYAKAENFSGTIIEAVGNSSSEYTYIRLKLDKGYKKLEIDAVHFALKNKCKCKFNRLRKPKAGEALLVFHSGLGKKNVEYMLGTVFVFKNYIVERPDKPDGRRDGQIRCSYSQKR